MRSQISNFKCTPAIAAAFLWFAAVSAPGMAQEDAPFPKFREHVINADAGTGLAITVADINNDGKLDIVGVSDKDVYWYENPDWTPHLMTYKPKNSNVCIVAKDLDGDGTPEFVLGADWQFNNTESGGALFLLYTFDDVTKPWTAVTLLQEEPTLHRIRWADVEGDGSYELVVAPLKGIGSTPPNFGDKAARLFLLRPLDEGPLLVPWQEREIIDESLHVMHNIWPVRGMDDDRDSILAASYEGVTRFRLDDDGKWQKEQIVEGNPEPLPQSGAGEIKTSAPVSHGSVAGANELQGSSLATIEPWHGHQAVVHAFNGESWQRFVLDDGLRGGHVVWWADFDGDGTDELLVGFRDKAPPDDKPGLQIYDLEYATGTLGPEDPVITGWTKHIIDDGGMATEDAMAADINGDGWPDVVAFGRATQNIKYYENLGLEKE